MSDLQGRRIPGEEGSRRRRPIPWIVLALIALVLLASLIPYAREALAGGGRGGGGISLVTFAVVGGALIVGVLAARLLWLWVSLLWLRRRRGE